MGRVRVGLVRVSLGNPNLIDRKLGGPDSDTSAHILTMHLHFGYSIDSPISKIKLNRLGESALSTWMLTTCRSQEVIRA